MLLEAHRAKSSFLHRDTLYLFYKSIRRLLPPLHPSLSHSSPLARMAAHLQLSGDNGPKMECRGNAIDGCSTHSVSQPVRSSSGMYAQTRLLEKKKPVAVAIHVSHNILNCLLFPRKGWQTSILPNFLSPCFPHE